MNHSTSHESKGVTHVPLNPAPINWSQITPHLPRSWDKVGRPFPIPTGALFIVGQQVPHIGKRFTVLQYHTGTDKILGFEPDERQVSYGTNKDARRAIAHHAERINAERHDVEPSDEYDDGEPTDRRQDQAVNGA